MTSEAGSRPRQAGSAPSAASHADAATTDPGTKRRGSRDDKAATNGRDAGSTAGHAAAAAGHAAAAAGHAAATNGSRSPQPEGQQRPASRPMGHTARHPHGPPSSLIQDDPLSALLNEAQGAVSGGANSLRDVRERYRSAYLDRVERWERLRTHTAPTAQTSQSANEEAMVGREVGLERSTLDRIDLAVRSLENAWLFLAREDTSLVNDPSGPPSAADAQMRIVEAQEAERTRLAREVHDGPAQALSNAIFQVEVVQRLLDRDEKLAREELSQLRDVLTRELRSVRAYMSQLRPPALADLGLSGAIQEAADQVATALDINVRVEIDDGVDTLPETVEIVTLRVVQEALQNARKHGQPSSIRVRMARDGGGWDVEVRDDGRGFDSDDPPVSGRRHFGLQFMRERAELIGARFEVRSSPNLGTAVRMTIPPGAMGMPIPGEDS